MGLWGHSTGGEIALQVVTARENVDAVVLFGSLSADAADNLPLVQREPGNRGEVVIRRYGLPEEAPAVWAKLSPLTYLAEAARPVSIHHGLRDKEVPHELSDRLWQTMQDSDLPGEYYTYRGQGHFLGGQAWERAMARTLAFFDKHVKQ